MADEEDDCSISLGYFRGPLETVLTAIQQAGLQHAVLELEGSPSEELYDFAERVSGEDADLRRKNRHARHGGWRLGAIRFGGGPLYVPVSEHTIACLLDMATRHAQPEIAFQLRVLAGDEVLVDAPDVGDNEIWVSPTLSEDAVAALRTGLAHGLDTAFGT